jgi:benzoyl-CoA-dihydrodiol lyase
VLPGTGGLTRVTDKRRVRRDLADVFCTTPEGIQGQRSKEWGLVDEVVKPQEFDSYVHTRASALAQLSDRPADAQGIELTPVARTIDEQGYHYKYVDVEFDREHRTATLKVKAPESHRPSSIHGILAAGAEWWPLQTARELDDAILSLRTNQLELGLWILKTEGDRKNVLDVDSALFSNRDHWFVREVIGMLRRTLSRLEVSSRSMYAIVEPGSCFAGSLFELALAADRVYMLDDPQVSVALSCMNFGGLEMVNGLARLEKDRFTGHVKLFSFLKRRSGVTHAQFLDRWHEIRDQKLIASKALRYVGRLVDNRVNQDSTDELPGMREYDLVTEMWFDSLATLIQFASDSQVAAVFLKSDFVEPAGTLIYIAEEKPASAEWLRRTQSAMAVYGDSLIGAPLGLAD